MLKKKTKKSIRDSVRGEAKSFLAGLKKFSQEAGGLAQRGSKEFTRVTQFGKLKGEIILLNQKKERKMKELGEKVMQSPKKSSIKEPGVIKVIKEIKELEEQKKDIEKQIRDLTKR